MSNARSEAFKDYPELLTSEHVAEILSITPQTARSYMRNGELPGSFHVGARWYMPKAKLIELVDGGGPVHV